MSSYNENMEKTSRSNHILMQVFHFNNNKNQFWLFEPFHLWKMIALCIYIHIRINARHLCMLSSSLARLLIWIKRTECTKSWNSPNRSDLITQRVSFCGIVSILHFLLVSMGFFVCVNNVEMYLVTLRAYLQAAKVKIQQNNCNINVYKTLQCMLYSAHIPCANK